MGKVAFVTHFAVAIILEMATLLGFVLRMVNLVLVNVMVHTTVPTAFMVLLVLVVIHHLRILHVETWNIGGVRWVLHDLGAINLHLCVLLESR